MENPYEPLDLLSLLSVLLGYQNLVENRQQSAHNDVSAANDKQAKTLLEELNKRFDEQNVMLRKILEVVNNDRHDRNSKGNKET